MRPLQRCVQEQRPVVGGCTEERTVFPRTYEVLKQGSAQALLSEKYEIDAEPYQSLMDALFCETFPQWKPLCLAFYSDRGLPLRRILRKEHTESIDTLLVAYLATAKKVAQDDLWVDGVPSWATFIETVLAVREESC